MMIELSDELGQALEARAAAEGLTLDKWFQHLAAEVRAKPRYKLAELLAQCDENAPLSEEDRAWLDDPPIGREVL